MRGSIPLSLALHVGAAAAFVYGWNPSGDDLIYVPAVPIDIITEAELGELLSVPEMVKADEIVPEETPPVAPDVEEDIPTAAEETPPDPPKEDPPKEQPPKIDPPKEENKPDQKKPDEKKPDSPKEKPPSDELDLAALGAAIDKDPDQDNRRRPNEVGADAVGGDRDQDRIGDGRKLSITEEAAFQAWMERCWTWDLGVPDSKNLVVSIRLSLTLTGELAGPIQVLNDGEINRSGNAYWRAARQRAATAAQACAPYTFLDPSNYQSWKVVTLNFRPPF